MDGYAFPPVSHTCNSCNTEQDLSVSVQDCSSSSSMASEVMVSRPTTATRNSAHKSPKCSRLSGSTKVRFLHQNPQMLALEAPAWKINLVSASPRVTVADFLLHTFREESAKSVL